MPRDGVVVDGKRLHSSFPATLLRYGGRMPGPSLWSVITRTPLVLRPIKSDRKLWVLESDRVGL